MKRRFSPGFTLIEVLTVIVIILIIAGWVVSAFGPANKNAARKRAQGEIQSIASACENYKAENGEYPRVAGKTEAASTGDSPIDPKKHGNPGASNYKDSSLELYRLLSGDTNLNTKLDSDESKKGYMTFENSLLAGLKTGKRVTTVQYLQDPFGNSYGYSTAGAKADESYRLSVAKEGAGAKAPTDVPGYNTTYDLWSTSGKTTSGMTAPTDLDRNQWVKNWP